MTEMSHVQLTHYRNSAISDKCILQFCIIYRNVEISRLSFVHFLSQSKPESRRTSRMPKNTKGKLKVTRNFNWEKLFSDDIQLYTLLRLNRFELIEFGSKLKEHLLRCRCCEIKFDDKISDAKEHIKSEEHWSNLKDIYRKETFHYLSDYEPTEEFTELLTQSLETIYTKVAMTKEELCLKLEAVDILKTILPDYEIVPYGSTFHGVGLKQSDINVFVSADDDFDAPKLLEIIETLLKRAPTQIKSVSRGFFCNNRAVLFTMLINGIEYECNLRIVCPTNLLTACVLKWVAGVDPRIVKLTVLLKYWAQLYGLFEFNLWPKYVPSIMVVSFLQKIKALPVLPADTCDIDGEGLMNTSDDLGTLWIKLLQYLYNEKSLIQILVNPQVLKTGIMRIAGNLRIEDPFHKSNIEGKSLNEFESFHHKYVRSCLGDGLQFFLIPKTEQGPIINSILNPLKDNLKIEIPEFEEYFNSQLSLLQKSLIKWIQCDENFIDVGNLKSFDVSRAKLLPLLKLDFIEKLSFSNGKCKVDPKFYKDACVFGGLFKVLISSFKLENVKILKDFTFFEKPTFQFCPKCYGKITEENCHCKYILPEPDMTFHKDYIKFLTSILVCTHDKIKASKRFEEALEDTASLVRSSILSIYPLSHLVIFGSYVSGFVTTSSDLDFCLTFTDNPDGKGLDDKTFIPKLAKNLRQFTTLTVLREIVETKVPILKCVCKKTGIEFDISLYNTFGPKNSQLLKLYNQIDDRVKVLVSCLKRLLSIQNFTKNGLSSYATTLMVIHYCQNTSPPLLPVLQELGADENIRSKPVKTVEDVYYYEDIENLANVWEYYKKNDASIGELWLGLLQYYCHVFDFDTDVVSIRTLDNVTKFDKDWNIPGICIEDPLLTNLNKAQTLSTKHNLQTIACLRKAFLVFTSNNEDYNNFPANIESLIDLYFERSILEDRTVEEEKPVAEEANDSGDEAVVEDIDIFYTPICPEEFTEKQIASWNALMEQGQIKKTETKSLKKPKNLPPKKWRNYK